MRFSSKTYGTGLLKSGIKWHKNAYLSRGRIYSESYK